MQMFLKSKQETLDFQQLSCIKLISLHELLVQKDKELHSLSKII